MSLTGRKWQEAVENCIMRSFMTSPNIIRVMKPRRMREAGHVARMGEMINAHKILVGKYEGVTYKT
jgi:hypothetical protein